MAFEYLPILAQNTAPKPPRVLAAPSKPSWRPVAKAVGRSRVALLTSAALRLADQPPFIPREDLSYRRIPSDPKAGALVIDHHSDIGTVPKQDPEIVFPRAALAELAEQGVVGSLSPWHFSFMGGIKQHHEIETALAPAIARDLIEAGVDLALLVPY